LKFNEKAVKAPTYTLQHRRYTEDEQQCAPLSSRIEPKDDGCSQSQDGGVNNIPS
jgi:hypothetical protein